jgi:hypothetical protein
LEAISKQAKEFEPQAKKEEREEVKDDKVIKHRFQAQSVPKKQAEELKKQEIP